MKFSLALVLFSTFSWAEPNQEVFNAQKTKMINHIDQRIEKLTKAKACYQASTNTEGMQTCRKDLKEGMKELKQDMQEDRKSFRSFRNELREKKRAEKLEKKEEMRNKKKD